MHASSIDGGVLVWHQLRQWFACKWLQKGSTACLIYATEWWIAAMNAGWDEVTPVYKRLASASKYSRDTVFSGRISASPWDCTPHSVCPIQFLLLWRLNSVRMKNILLEKYYSILLHILTLISLSIQAKGLCAAWKVAISAYEFTNNSR